MNIIKKFIKFNTSKRTTEIKYIVIHDTGNTDIGSNAEASFKYFNTGDRKSSADFFVDDRQIIQTVDYTKNFSWHCGDGRGKYGITNANSIGIEICINTDSDRTSTIANTVELVKLLMVKLNIPIERVVRHYDASRKICPKIMSNDNWKLWEDFKMSLQNKHFAKESYDLLNKTGITIHEERFDDKITRGEVFVLLYKLIKLLAK